MTVKVTTPSGLPRHTGVLTDEPSTAQIIPQGPPAPANAITSVNGHAGPGAVTVIKDDLGLANVDNKSSATIRSEITAANIAAPAHAAALKATPVDADEITGLDSAASFSLMRVTWANIKATLKTYFDTLYAAAVTLTSHTSAANPHSGSAASGAVGSSGITMSTARLLGRTTAATGVIEEIATGTNVTLAAGILNAAENGITTAGQMVLRSNVSSGDAYKFYTPNQQGARFMFQNQDRLVVITANDNFFQVAGSWVSNSNFPGGTSAPSSGFYATNTNGTVVFFSLGGRNATPGVMVLSYGPHSNTGAALELIEMTAPAAPPDSGVRIYAEASGKVVAKFSSGTTRVIGNSSGTLSPAVYTVATLPSASTSGNGARTHVSDALAPTFGATVASGGAVSTPVYSDGTNWKVG